MARLISSQTPSPVVHQHPSNLVHSRHAYLPVKMEQSVPKRRHINFNAGELPKRKRTTNVKLFDFVVTDFCSFNFSQ
jgi:hypothetical protein